jgi:hypothetical protein
MGLDQPPHACKLAANRCLEPLSSHTTQLLDFVLSWHRVRCRTFPGVRRRGHRCDNPQRLHTQILFPKDTVRVLIQKRRR